MTRKELLRKIGFGAVVIAVAALGLWAYFHYVYYAGPTIAWKRDGKEYELLSPRNLIIAAVGAPFFIWMIGRSLADLPWPQRIISVILRIVFVSLLAFGLARLARTARPVRRGAHRARVMQQDGRDDRGRRGRHAS